MSMQTTRGTKNWAVKALPSFRGRKSFVLPGAFYQDIVVLMAESGFEKASTVEEADVVVFTGGSDINPALYQQKPIQGTYFDSDRDIVEEAIYQKCIKLDKIMFGICRGAQFLHAMNGGELWQDVQGHGSSHMIIDVDEDVRVEATSIHHQMLQINEKITIIAVCEEQVSTKFRDENMFIDLSREGVNAAAELEIEAGCYLDTKCFFVQGHPEVGSLEYRSWTMQKLLDFVEEWENNKMLLSSVPMLLTREV